MLRTLVALIVGVVIGAAAATTASSSSPPQASSKPGSPVVQMRLYTIDKGRLDDFARAWRAGVYPLRLKMGYQIPFAATILATNQFVWLVAYDGPESWEAKEAAYYASAARTQLSPDPAQWIARPEQMMVAPVVNFVGAPAPQK